MTNLLLEVQKTIHVSWWKVSSDEGFLLYSSDNFTAHHIWYVEKRGLNVKSRWSLLLYHYYCAQQQESVDKDFWTDHVRVQTWFQLWQGQRRREARESTR